MIDTILSHPQLKALRSGINLLLLLSISTLFIGSAAAPLPQTPPLQQEPLSALIQETDTSLTVEGRLVPRQFVTLSTAISGQVVGLFVSEGDMVEAGTVLLRLGDEEQLNADLAAAEFELLSAQQALDQLDDNIGVELALAQKSLAEAEKTLAFAESRVSSLQRGYSQDRIDQVYANMLLAELGLKRAKEDYARWQQKFNNGNNIIWQFIKKRQFKLLLTALEKQIASAERRYQDSVQKYEDLKKGVDPVDMAIAESDLAVAQANVAEAQKEVAILSNGPDPDLVAAAQARITAAETTLIAAQTALTDSELVAPIVGKVVDLNIKNGEWAESGQPVMVIADDSAWLVETDDLTEIDVPQVYLGQPVIVTPDALPDMELAGVVETIKDLSEEKRGDVTYTVTIRLDKSDPRLRWGMTVAVAFEQ
jgi:multidrug resistance efflux pump